MGSDPESQGDGDTASRLPSFTKERDMALEWTDDLGRVDWHELSALYKAAPLGEKPPDETVALRPVAVGRVAL